MPLPRLLATGLWLAVTVASTAMVWTATSIVAADVTDRPAAVLAHQDVVSELESGSPVPTTTSTSIPPSGGTPNGRGPAPASPSQPGPAAAPSQASQPAGAAVTVPPVPTPTTVPPAPTNAAPTSPSAPQPPSRPSATYSTSGGVVRVACNGFFIDLVSAIPNSGYSVKVVAGGPANVEVHFLRAGQDVSVKAVCFGQPIRYYDQYPPR